MALPVRSGGGIVLDGVWSEGVCRQEAAGEAGRLLLVPIGALGGLLALGLRRCRPAAGRIRGRKVSGHREVTFAKLRPQQSFTLSLQTESGRRGNLNQLRQEFDLR